MFWFEQIILRNYKFPTIYAVNEILNTQKEYYDIIDKHK